MFSSARLTPEFFTSWKCFLQDFVVINILSVFYPYCDRIKKLGYDQKFEVSDERRT
jgi:hypothetical protein